MNRHIHGSFIIVPYAAVFALVALFGFVMSLFMQEEKTINVYGGKKQQ